MPLPVRHMFGPAKLRRGIWIRWTARILLGGTFIYAGIQKISSPGDFANIVMNFGILPPPIAVYFSFLLPWLEFFLGVFLVIDLFVRESALVLSSLLVVFLAALILRSLDGGLESCGCFSLREATHPSIFLLTFRDIALLGCGWCLISPKGEGPRRDSPETSPQS